MNRSGMSSLHSRDPLFLYLFPSLDSLVVGSVLAAHIQKLRSYDRLKFAEVIITIESNLPYVATELRNVLVDRLHVPRCGFMKEARTKKQQSSDTGSYGYDMPG